MKRKLYQSMRRIRLVEEMIAERYSDQKMHCPTHLSIGQEAVASGVGLALKRSDLAVSGHRAHAHYLGKGGDLNQMIAEIHGKSTGCSGGLGGSMHLIDRSVGFAGSTAIVGGTIPLAVGLALSIQLRKGEDIACAFLGDGAVEEGVFYESVNFAVLRNLPVLFVCENNLYSVYSPLRVRQPTDRKIFEMVRAMGISSTCEDGNDAQRVYDVVRERTGCIRRGEGPQFIEFMTYRWREHCGPNYDNHIGYRSEDEFLSWKEKDPILKIEKELISSKELTMGDVKTIGVQLREECESAFDKALDAAFPDPDEFEKYLFREREGGAR